MSRATATFLVLAVACCLGACASRHPKPAPSSWRIIEEGDRNPFISDDPGHAGEVIKNDRR